MKKNNGFTIIEIVAVLTIISIVAVVTIHGNGTPDNVPAREAEILKSHLRFTRLMALSNDTDTWGIALSTAADTYTLEKNGATAALNLPGEDSPTHAMPSGAGIVSVTNGGVPATSILFDEWGSPGANDHEVEISGSITIRVSGNTGFVK